MAVGVAVPLISAALAALVAWIVARSTARSARENWLLDKRHTVYERLVDTAVELVSHSGAPGTPALALKEAMADPSKQGALLVSLRRVHLVAPDRVASAAHAVIDTAGPGHGTFDHQRTVDALNTLMREMRRDLIPQRMR